jgi:hypothetical protein
MFLVVFMLACMNNPAWVRLLCRAHCFGAGIFIEAREGVRLVSWIGIAAQSANLHESDRDFTGACYGEIMS